MYEPSYISEQMTNVEQLPRQGQVDWQPWQIIFPIISEGAKKRPLTLYPLTLEWKSNPGSPLATGPMKRPVLDPKSDV